MALQGKYNYKGIEVNDAYIKVSTVNYNVGYTQELTEKSPAEYNEDGSLKKDAVIETKWIANNGTQVSFKVYKDKASREANPNESFTDGYLNIAALDTKASAKNPVIQAYNAMKAMDDFKDYTDV
tara:strand:- start:2367 stop:2741 length:375 start_codon:yes stop_codon:yes gene_type:complete